MTRNVHQQHGLEYYASIMESKDDDGGKEMSVQPINQV